MDRFLSPPGLPPRGAGELARVLGIDRRRAAPYAVPLRRGQQRRNSMEPIVPGLSEHNLERRIATRRRSMPVAHGLDLSNQSALDAENVSIQSLFPDSLTLREFDGANITNAANCARGSPRSTSKQWMLVDVIAIPGLREDYYSTLMATACTSYPGEGEDWAFVHESPFDSCDEDLLSLNRLGEVLLAASWYACRWTPQLGPQLFRHHAQGHVTCVAVTRLGYCVVGDESGYLLLFDMVQDPPPLLIRQRLCDIAAFGDDCHASASPDKVKTHATHAIWSEKTPLTEGTALSRCGYRIEFFVGTNSGALCKIFVDTPLRLVAEVVTPLHLRHKEAICSMALDYNQDMLVVAGVDSEVSIWTHLTATQGSTALTHLYRFQQFSAIKGMAFCPGLDHLVALGGGRRDRVLRIYDIEARKLVRKVAMPAQVVGVVWVSRWELFVALGHSRQRHYVGLGKVYNLATGCVVCDIPGPGYALSAVKTNRGVSVYTSQHMLMEFRWTAEASPKPSTAVLASLNVTYPPTALR